MSPDHEVDIHRVVATLGRLLLGQNNHLTRCGIEPHRVVRRIRRTSQDHGGPVRTSPRRCVPCISYADAQALCGHRPKATALTYELTCYGIKGHRSGPFANHRRVRREQFGPIGSRPVPGVRKVICAVVAAEKNQLAGGRVVRHRREGAGPSC